MSTEQLVLFILLALLAEVLGTVGGFGSSMLFVPLAGFFMDFQSVLGITALFHVSSNLSKILLFRKGIDKKLVLYLGIPAVLLVITGAFVSNYLQPVYLEAGLAVFLISLSLILLIKQNWAISPTKTNAALGGVLSGFVAGLLGTGGAIRGLVMAAFNLKMEVFIATSALIDLAIDASRSVVYVYNGYVHRHDLYLVPILIGVSIAGTWIGKKILSRVSEAQFKKIVLILVLITGVSALYKVATVFL